MLCSAENPLRKCCNHRGSPDQHRYYAGAPPWCIRGAAVWAGGVRGRGAGFRRGSPAASNFIGFSSGLAPRDNLVLHFLDIIGGVLLFHELLVVADEGGVISGWGNLQLAGQGQSGHGLLVCGKGSLGVGRKNASRIGRRGYACIGWQD